MDFPFPPRSLAEMTECALKEIGTGLIQLYQRKKQTASPKELAKEADLWSSHRICEYLNTLPLEANILDEEREFEDKNAPWTWVVDPLDGSSNFSAGFPLWGISLALCYEGVPFWGGVYLPVLDRFYWAAKGEGAWRNQQRIQTCREAQYASHHLFGYAGSLPIPEWLQFFPGKLRHIGSIATDLVFFAEGKYIALCVLESHLWDMLAGYLIAKEAGAVLWGIKGALEPFDAQSRQEFSFFGKANSSLPDFPIKGKWLCGKDLEPRPFTQDGKEIL